jgi:uncharacterized PurR-regulated membrane protein YhhQ (DUF165 family)
MLWYNLSWGFLIDPSLGFIQLATLGRDFMLNSLDSTPPYAQSHSGYYSLAHTPRTLVASFLTYPVGEFVNSFVLAKTKVASGGRWSWTRTIPREGLWAVQRWWGQGLDSLAFITLAFVGMIPLAGLASATVTQWLSKSVYKAAVTSLTYAMVNFLKRRERFGCV